jgi:hypothetical protein
LFAQAVKTVGFPQSPSTWTQIALKSVLKREFFKREWCPVLKIKDWSRATLVINLGKAIEIFVCTATQVTATS